MDTDRKIEELKKALKALESQKRADKANEAVKKDNSAEIAKVRDEAAALAKQAEAKRRADLTSLASAAAERVGQSRQPERLAPMNPFERKVVHDVIAAADGVRSESEGEEPNRRVVVLPDA